MNGEAKSIMLDKKEIWCCDEEIQREEANKKKQFKL